MKLGGWHRLWLLASVIWLIPVVFVAVMVMPKASEYEVRRYSATKELIKKEATLNVKMPDGITIVNIPKGIKKAELEQLYGKPLTKNPKSLDFGIQMEFSNLLWRNAKQSAEEFLDEQPEERVQRLHKQYGKWIDFSPIESKYKEDLQKMRSKRLKISLVGVGFWFASIMIVYLLGWAIGWVFKGFKSRGDT